MFSRAIAREYTHTRHPGCSFKYERALLAAPTPQHFCRAEQAPPLVITGHQCTTETKLVLRAYGKALFAEPEEKVMRYGQRTHSHAQTNFRTYRICLLRRKHTGSIAQVELDQFNK